MSQNFLSLNNWFPLRMVILCKAHMLISMICFAAQKTIEIVCAFQIGYRLNAWVYIHLSHSGCEVVVKAKDLCYIQRKVDINDAGFKFNNILKAHKNIWRPNLLVIIGRWIATTINLFHGSPHSPFAYGIFEELSHPCWKN